jgi:hypothetical protein
MESSDAPVDFGYKWYWYIVKSHETEKIAEVINLQNIIVQFWKEGIDAARNGYVFITPAVNGWSFIVGNLPTIGEYLDINARELPQLKKFLELLSSHFGEAQFFFTFRTSELHGWAKAVNGKMERIYVFAFDAGTLAIEGEPTAFEKEFRLANTLAGDKLFDEELFEPREEFVMSVAENWSINPSTLSKRTDAGNKTGLLGEL